MDSNERPRLTAREEIKQVLNNFEYKKYPTLWDTDVVRDAAQLLDEIYDLGRKRYDIAPIAWTLSMGNLPTACLMMVHAKKYRQRSGLAV